MPNDIDRICERLLDSEEHATESAIPAVAEDAVEIIRGLEADALRFRKLREILQNTYDGNAFETENLTIHCAMQSGWQSNRIVTAEITWKDKRDAELGLSQVLDNLPAGVVPNNTNPDVAGKTGCVQLSDGKTVGLASNPKPRSAP